MPFVWSILCPLCGACCNSFQEVLLHHCPTEHCSMPVEQLPLIVKKGYDSVEGRLVEEDGSTSDSGDSNGHTWIFKPRHHMLPSVFDGDGYGSNTGDADGDDYKSCVICKKPAHVRLTCTNELMCTHCTESTQVVEWHQSTCSMGSSCIMAFTMLEDDEESDEQIQIAEDDEPGNMMGQQPDDDEPSNRMGFAQPKGWQFRIKVYMCFLVNDLVPGLEGAMPIQPALLDCVLVILETRCPLHGLEITAEHDCKFCGQAIKMAGLVLESLLGKVVCTMQYMHGLDWIGSSYAFRLD